MSLNADKLLEAFTGYAEQKLDQAREPRFAVVDWGYSHRQFEQGIMPRVQFYGEGEISERRYKVAGPVAPRAGDVVVMLPTPNNTWIIVAVMPGNTSLTTENHAPRVYAENMYVVQDWTTASLESGWTHNGNNNGTVRWRVINLLGTEFAQWRGGVNSSTTGTITTVPPVARPVDRQSIVVARNANTNNEVKIDFNTDGSCTMVGGTTGGASNPTWLSFAGVQYVLRTV